MKNQKGITLIALIITIIVMLILVGVSVSTAINTGLFRTASGVSQNTQRERDNELIMSDGQVNLKGTYRDLDVYVNDLTGNPGATLPEGVEIGDYVEYDCGVASYTAGWRILGMNEKGQILLTSEDMVITNNSGKMDLEYAPDDYIGDYNDVFLDRNLYCFGSKSAYDTYIEKLDGECATYANGPKVVEARSIRLEDIRRITGSDNLNDLDSNSGAYKMLLTNGTVADYSYEGYDPVTDGPIMKSTGEVMRYFLADKGERETQEEDGIYMCKYVYVVNFDSLGRGNLWQYYDWVDLEEDIYLYAGARPVIVLSTSVTLTQKTGETKDGCNVFTME